MDNIERPDNSIQTPTVTTTDREARLKIKFADETPPGRSDDKVTTEARVFQSGAELTDAQRKWIWGDHKIPFSATIPAPEVSGKAVKPGVAYWPVFFAGAGRFVPERLVLSATFQDFKHRDYESKRSYLRRFSIGDERYDLCTPGERFGLPLWTYDPRFPTGHAFSTPSFERDTPLLLELVSRQTLTIDYDDRYGVNVEVEGYVSGRILLTSTLPTQNGGEP